MDKSDRARYKQLANDSIIATYGRDDNEARLAQALEACVEDLEYHDSCDGPQLEPEAAVNLDTLQAIYGQLKERLVEIEDATNALDDRLDDLREAVKDFKNDVKELESEL